MQANAHNTSFSPVALNILIETEIEYEFFKLLFGSTIGIPSYLTENYDLILSKQEMRCFMEEIANKLNKY